MDELWTGGDQPEHLTPDEWGRSLLPRNRLFVMWKGLDRLASEVGNLELAFRDRQRTLVHHDCFDITSTGVHKLFCWEMFPSDCLPLMTSEECVYLVNVFDWYAVTACDFIGLQSKVFELAKGKDLAKTRDDRIRDISPNMLVYRHKVGAHKAYVEPRKGDKEAGLDLGSLVCSLVFRTGLKFAMRLPRIRPQKSYMSYESVAKHDWSVTEVHQKMSDLYGHFGEGHA